MRSGEIMKAVGDSCSVVVAAVGQEKINRFGEVHGTNGRTHTDPEFAENSVFKGVIVQGTLVLAPVLEALKRIYGAKRWLAGGEIETKFTSFTRPYDVVTAVFEVKEVGEAGMTIAYVCTKDDGTVVQMGTAKA